MFVIRLNLGKCIHYEPIHQMAPEEQESSKEYGKVKKVKKKKEHKLGAHLPDRLLSP